MDSISSFQVRPPPGPASLCDDKSGYQHLKIHPDSQKFFSFFHGEAIIFLSAPYLSDGKQVPFYIITLALSSPVPCGLWAYQFLSILMTDMWASHSYPVQRFASLVANSHKQQPLFCYFFSFQRDVLLTLQRVLHGHHFC